MIEEAGKTMTHVGTWKPRMLKLSTVLKQINTKLVT